MARIHSHKHGKSHSIRPTSKRPPGWVNYSAEEVVALIIKLAKDGLSPSKIGITLRDEYGIPLVKAITGKSIVEILRENKLAPQIPEDLQNLLNKAQRVRDHLSKHRGDRKNIHSLELIEAKIYRLSKYYKRIGLLSPDFKYTTMVAQLK